MEFSVAAVAGIIGASGVAACPRSGSGPVKGRMPKLVIQLLLFRVAEHRVGLCYLFKLLFCLWISRICIRVIFLCKLPVRFLYRILIRVSVNAKHFIVVSLCFHLYHLPIIHIRKLSKSI